MRLVSLESESTGGIAMRVIECRRRGLLLAAVAIVAWAGILAAAEPTLTLVVMDPLAAPLSCPCVKGYAQRLSLIHISEPTRPY